MPFPLPQGTGKGFLPRDGAGRASAANPCVLLDKVLEPDPKSGA